jgi:hypothetical protein
MKKLKKFILPILGVFAVVAIVLQFTYSGGVVGAFMDLGMKMTSSMKQRDISSEKAAFAFKADSLTNAFKTDAGAIAKYIDKAILVEGAITAMEGTHLAMGNIACNLDSSELKKMSALKIGDATKIQGRLTTYNDLMEEISMDKCVIK